MIVSLYFAMPYRYRWLLLLLGSYYFYMAWEPFYLLLIISSTLVDYVAGIMMGKADSKPKRRMWLAFSLITNLGLLFSFKYYNFFRESLGFLWPENPLPMSEFLLPVGISFYTFQTLSYTIEVYRGKQKPERHLGIFALYVAFFPQLVAGPIERSLSLLPQFFKKCDFDYDRVVGGLRLMLWGMFKKVVIADRMAILVDNVYDSPEGAQGPILAIATVCFAVQIYCDFSGYSDIAIGAARVMGIKLMTNFDKPYFSGSIAEFWGRWHISLSTWFRDYVYIPLGGSRVGKLRFNVNILIVFAVSGLWHGARWTFVIWGLLHALYYIASKLTAGIRESFTAKVGLTKMPRLHKLTQVAITFFLVNVAWIFFRANSLADAMYIVSHLLTGWKTLVGPEAFIILQRSLEAVNIYVIDVQVISLVLLALVTIDLLQAKGNFADWLDKHRTVFRWSVYYALVLGIFFLGVYGEKEFIYFVF